VLREGGSENGQVTGNLGNVTASHSITVLLAKYRVFQKDLNDLNLVYFHTHPATWRLNYEVIWRASNKLEMCQNLLYAIFHQW
jgi:hypothetical protein